MQVRWGGHRNCVPGKQTAGLVWKEQDLLVTPPALWQRGSRSRLFTLPVLVRTCCLLVIHEPYELMGAVLTATAIDILWEQPGEGDFLPIFWLGELLFTLQNPALCHPFYEIQLFLSKHASASGPLRFLFPLSPWLSPWLRPGRVFLFRHYIK